MPPGTAKLKDRQTPTAHEDVERPDPGPRWRGCHMGQTLRKSFVVPQTGKLNPGIRSYGSTQENWKRVHTQLVRDVAIGNALL